MKITRIVLRGYVFGSLTCSDVTKRTKTNKDNTRFTGISFRIVETI